MGGKVQYEVRQDERGYYVWNTRLDTVAYRSRWMLRRRKDARLVAERTAARLNAGRADG